MIWLVKGSASWSAVDVDHSTVGTGATYEEAFASLREANAAYFAACAFDGSRVARPVRWRSLAWLAWMAFTRRAYPYSARVVAAHMARANQGPAVTDLSDRDINVTPEG